MLPTPADLVADPWACGPYCWVIDEVRVLPEPIPCRGTQGLWHVGPSISAALSAATGLGSYRWWQALTVLQPYATAISHGPKRVENRPWRRRLPAEGLWLGLHAGKALAGSEYEVVDVLNAWRDNAVGYGWEPSSGPRWAEAPDLGRMPRGAMLGAMHVSAIVMYPQDTGLFPVVESR